MAPGLILGIFPRKRKTRFSPYITWVCELFSTALLIFLSTSTWLFIVGILVASHSILWLFSAIECTWEIPTALGKPSRRYLKRYLKYFFNDFSQFFSKAIFLTSQVYFKSNSSFIISKIFIRSSFVKISFWHLNLLRAHFQKLYPKCLSLYILLNIFNSFLYLGIK